MSHPSDPPDLERLQALLDAERAQLQALLVDGAAELARRDEVVEKLRARQANLMAERDEARAKVRLYEGSRVLRSSAKLVLRIRRLRGIA
jgi:hypothetical protein